MKTRSRRRTRTMGSILVPKNPPEDMDVPDTNDRADQLKFLARDHRSGRSSSIAPKSQQMPMRKSPRNMPLVIDLCDDVSSFSTECEEISNSGQYKTSASDNYLRCDDDENKSKSLKIISTRKKPVVDLLSPCPVLNRHKNDIAAAQERRLREKHRSVTSRTQTTTPTLLTLSDDSETYRGRSSRGPNHVDTDNSMYFPALQQQSDTDQLDEKPDVCKKFHPPADAIMGILPSKSINENRCLPPPSRNKQLSSPKSISSSTDVFHDIMEGVFGFSVARGIISSRSNEARRQQDDASISLLPFSKSSSSAAAENSPSVLSTTCESEGSSTTTKKSDDGRAETGSAESNDMSYEMSSLSSSRSEKGTTTRNFSFEYRDMKVDSEKPTSSRESYVKDRAVKYIGGSPSASQSLKPGSTSRGTNNEEKKGRHLFQVPREIKRRRVKRVSKRANPSTTAVRPRRRRRFDLNDASDLQPSRRTTRSGAAVDKVQILTTKTRLAYNFQFIPGDVPNFWECPNCRQCRLSDRAKNSVIYYTGQVVPDINNYKAVRLHFQQCWEQLFPSKSSQLFASTDESVDFILSDDDSDCIDDTDAESLEDEKNMDDNEEDEEPNQRVVPTLPETKATPSSSQHKLPLSSGHFSTPDDFRTDVQASRRNRSPSSFKKEVALCTTEGGVRRVDTRKLNQPPSTRLAHASSQPTNKKGEGLKDSAKNSPPATKMPQDDEVTNALADRRLAASYEILIFSQMRRCYYIPSRDKSCRLGAIKTDTPGMECKHCPVESTRRRFFYRSLATMSSHVTEFEYHIMKCKGCPLFFRTEV